MRRAAGAGAALLIAIAVAALYPWARDLPLASSLEGQALDLRFRLRGELTPGPHVVLIMIDDATVAGLGRWPLSRGHMAKAVEVLRADGARLVVFDLLFAEAQAGLPSGLLAALRALKARLPEDAGEAARGLDGILAAADPDARFAAAIRAAGNVLLPFTFVFDPAKANATKPPRFVEDAAYAVYRLPPGERPGLRLSPAGLLVPPAAIARAARPAGHVTISLDPDGDLRHEAAVIGYRGDYYPSLPIEAARAFLGLPKQGVAALFGRGIQIGDRLLPADTGMRLVVNYYGPQGTFETHSFVDLIEGRLPRAAVRDRIVLIGGAAVGIGGSFATPFTQTLPGTEHYATVIDNILEGRALRRDRWVAALDLMVIVVAGLAAAAVARTRRLVTSAAGLVALVVGIGAMAQAAFAGGLWLNVVFPTAAVALNYAPFALFRGLREQRARRRAERHRRNLARYFPPAVVDALADRDAPFAFDRSQEAAVMFVDIVGFTRIAERLAPAAAMALLREFHVRVERAVFAFDGTLDKFLGDGALACFGIPEPRAADALNALGAARELAEDIGRWRAELEASGRPAIRIGIGIHYGPVLTGDVGGERQFQFTVTGDTVNVASRLEGLTRGHGATVVASDALVAAARTADGGAAGELLGAFAPLAPQRLRGREETMRLWAWREPGAG